MVIFSLSNNVLMNLGGELAVRLVMEPRLGFFLTLECLGHFLSLSWEVSHSKLGHG